MFGKQIVFTDVFFVVDVIEETKWRDGHQRNFTAQFHLLSSRANRLPAFYFLVSHGTANPAKIFCTTASLVNSSASAS